MNDKTREFERFCESYIQAAEEEWGKSEDAVDLTAATVAYQVVLAGTPHPTGQAKEEL